MFSNSSYSSLSSQFFYMLVLCLQIPFISSTIVETRFLYVAQQNELVQAHFFHIGEFPFS